MKKIFLQVILIFQTAILIAAPNWQVNTAAYELSMTVTAAISAESGLDIGDNDQLAAFVGDECRGVVEVVYEADYSAYVFYLSIFSNQYEGEEVEFKYYNHAADSIYNNIGSLIFKAGDNLGSVSSPFVVNKATTGVQLSLSNTSIYENMPEQSKVADIVVSENNEAVADYNLVLTEGNENFEIKDGALLSAQAFNFEEIKSYAIKVLAYNADSTLVVVDSFNIAVLDTNDAPSLITINNDTISENMPVGTFVCKVAVSDEDANDEITLEQEYPLGEDYPRFILSNDSVYTNRVFDYETASVETLTIIASDKAGAKLTQTFSIKVNDVLETGIANTEFIELRVYPNPVIKELHFSLDDIASVSVFNTKGKLVKHVVGVNNSICVAELPIGVYVIELESNNQKYTQRFIKE